MFEETNTRLKSFLPIFSKILHHHIQIPSVECILINNAAWLGLSPFTLQDSKLVLLKSKWMIIRWYITLAVVTSFRFLLVFNIVKRYLLLQLQGDPDLARNVDFESCFRVAILSFTGVFDLYSAYMRNEVVSFYNNNLRFFKNILGKYKL